MKNKKEISIVVCFDENYALNGAMTLYSTSQNIRDGVKIKAYIINGGVKEKTRKKFKKIESDTLEIIWLNPDLSIFDNLPLSSWTTKAAHARLLVPDLIKEEKIIYLDSDMLVLDDIYELWNVLFGKYIIAASQSLVAPSVNKRPNCNILIEAGMNKKSPYFSTGLLLINTNRWKRKNILGEYISLLKNMGTKFIYRNQDPLNVILENSWKKLDEEWQVTTPTFYSLKKEDQKLAKNAKIIHFTGTPPGFPRCNHPKKKIFYDYVIHSGWFSAIEYINWYIELLIKDFFYMNILKLKSFLKSLNLFPKK
jgi:lipopolysaccharide biosynthesis glycosyltransferase